MLHICCAPCTIFPFKVLKEQGLDILGLFYNPNIHPYSEYARRRDTLTQYAPGVDLEIFYPADYQMEDFLRGVAFREKDRCLFCYHHRLGKTAEFAKSRGIDVFSTTLLYSRFQKHEAIREIGTAVAAEYGLEFHYEDFRKGWKEGIEISKKLGMYRQQYCGCIYSEKDRFFKK